MRLKDKIIVLNLIISIISFNKSAYCVLIDGYYDQLNERPDILTLNKINYYKDFPKRIIEYDYDGNKKIKDTTEYIDYKFKYNQLIEQIEILSYIDISSDKEAYVITKHKYEYENDQLTKILVYRSENLNNLDKKLIKTIFITYNKKNKIQSLILQNDFLDSKNKEIYEYLYDNNLNPVKYICTYFNPSTNKMELSDETDFIYKNNKLINTKINDKTSLEEYIYEYPNKNTIIKKSKDETKTCTYSNKGLLINELTKHFATGTETKYDEVNIEYDNQNRLKAITVLHYNNPKNKFKEFSQYNFIKEFIYNEPKKAKVTASDNLRLRNGPSLDSEKITLIPSNETVELIKESETWEDINGKIGKWTKVKWKSYEGWVFNAYLEYEQ